MCYFRAFQIQNGTIGIERECVQTPGRCRTGYPEVESRIRVPSSQPHLKTFGRQTRPPVALAIFAAVSSVNWCSSRCMNSALADECENMSPLLAACCRTIRLMTDCDTFARRAKLFCEILFLTRYSWRVIQLVSSQ